MNASLKAHDKEANAHPKVVEVMFLFYILLNSCGHIETGPLCILLNSYGHIETGPLGILLRKTGADKQIQTSIPCCPDKTFHIKLKYCLI